MEESAKLPVDFLRTGAYLNWNDKTPRECMEERFATPWRFPDQPAMATVAYVNMTEYSNLGSWDAAFDPAWDLDGDAIIDDGAGPLPDYVDDVFNAEWKNYIAKYWTEGWREVLRQRIDLAAAQRLTALCWMCREVPGGIRTPIFGHGRTYLAGQRTSAMDLELCEGAVRHGFPRHRQLWRRARLYRFWNTWMEPIARTSFQLGWFRHRERIWLVDLKKKYENLGRLLQGGVQMLNMEHLGTGVPSEGRTLWITATGLPRTDCSFFSAGRSIQEARRSFQRFSWMSLITTASRVFPRSFRFAPFPILLTRTGCWAANPTMRYPRARVCLIYGPGDDEIDGGEGNDAPTQSGIRTTRSCAWRYCCRYRQKR